jgi:hypothetical protein
MISVWVIVYRLTKVAHFRPVKITYTGPQLAELYMPLVQKPFLVLADNPFLVSVILADTICTIRKMTDFWYQLFRTETNNHLMVSVVINDRYE